MSLTTGLRNFERKLWSLPQLVELYEKFDARDLSRNPREPGV
jgi:hypothetical protein